MAAVATRTLGAPGGVNSGRAPRSDRDRGRHDLAVAGLTQMLANPARYEIVQAGCASPPPDVLLYSVDDSDGGHDPELHALVRRGTSTVVVVHWEDSAPGVAAALACGAHGAVSLKLAAADLLDEVEKVRLGSEPGTEPPSRGSCHPEIARAGLTRGSSTPSRSWRPASPTRRSRTGCSSPSTPSRPTCGPRTRRSVPSGGPSP